MFPKDIRSIQAAYSQGGDRAAMAEIRRCWPGLPEYVARGAIAQIMAMPIARTKEPPGKGKGE